MKVQPLKPELAPLMEALMEQSRVVLVDLCRRLPVDARAAKAVWGTDFVHQSPAASHATYWRDLFSREDEPERKAFLSRVRKESIACYLAAAAQHGLAKALEEVLERQKETQRVMRNLLSLTRDVEDIPLLALAFRGPKKESVTEGGSA